MMTTRDKIATSSSEAARFGRNVLFKGLLLFFLFNLTFALWNPSPWLGRISAYNHLVPGRTRLPYGDNPSRAYNLSLFNLDAMLASHEISASPKPPDEYRVILIGDSSTWGYLLPANKTLSAAMNAEGLTLPDGRKVRTYNLGYPVMSLAKDLLILSYAKRYDPDLVIWLFTLESFPYDKQLFPPLVQNNPGLARDLIRTYDLKLDAQDPALHGPSWWEKTIVGARRPLADLLRLQLYGVLWAATGIDQDLPEVYTPRMEDLPADQSFHNLQPPHLEETDLAFDILEAGLSMAGDTPILFLNEPMFVSQGQNSDIRYNFYYPKWAYDDYRRLIEQQSTKNGWRYLDLWDLILAEEFTNSAVHLTANGTQQLAQRINQAIEDIIRAQ